jgi:hypothetical protein
MRPVIRYQSQLLYRKSYKPDRVIRIRPAKLNFEFRPVRFGLKPKITTYECQRLAEDEETLARYQPRGPKFAGFGWQIISWRS